MIRSNTTARALFGAWVALFLHGAAFAQTGDMRDNKSAPRPEAAAQAMGVDTQKLASIDAEQATRARAIGNDLVCLCGDCPKRTISDCECWWAQTNKRALQAAVAKGMPTDQVMSAYRRVYGDQVLAMVPNEGFARAAWMLPYAVGVIGLLVVFGIGAMYMRRARQPGRQPLTELPAPREDPARVELARELEELD